jgi:hypothetical protein
VCNANLGEKVTNGILMGACISILLLGLYNMKQLRQGRRFRKSIYLIIFMVFSQLTILCK